MATVRLYTFSRRAVAAVVVCAGLLLVVGAPRAFGQGNPSPASLFGPAINSTAQIDDSIRFSWLTYNSQDFYRVVFSRYRTFGWEAGPSTRETVLSWQYVTPRDVGLSVGTWYWRICYGWNDDPSHTCYLDEGIRTLVVEAKPTPPPSVTPTSPTESAPYLTLTEAKGATRYAIRKRFKVTARVPRCARVNDSEILCRAEFRRRGRNVTRIVDVQAQADGIYYSIRNP